MKPAPHQSVTGLLAALFAGFLIIAALIAAAAAVTLFARGTPLSSIWGSKESTYHELLRHRPVLGTGFTEPAVALSFAAAGWIAGRRWGWVGSSAPSSSGLIHWRTWRRWPQPGISQARGSSRSMRSSLAGSCQGRS
jgi:hypothetical protein